VNALRSNRQSRRSFTLIELVMVIAIMAFLMGMIGSLIGLNSIQNTQVKLAAEQLAAVLRQTRQLAMDHQAMYGVTFNIANAPGSTGQVLNNRSGGHWYRILGPHDFGSVGWSGYGGYRMPNFPNPSLTYSGPVTTPVGYSMLPGWLASIETDFFGPKYVLPPGKVRFIALTDEDNGNFMAPNSGFDATYPRPWFGNFIKGPGDSAPRLYPWGGYDPEFLDNGGQQGIYWRTNSDRHSAGFYYQGTDPTIVGCVNPVTRPIINDPTGSGAIVNGIAGCQTYPLFTQGQSRPLINGNWLDCLLLFNPDGTCMRQDWMQMRHVYGQIDYSENNYWYNLQQNTIQYLAPGDMCNGETSWQHYYAGVPYNTLFEASDYDNVTGMFYITLGPDIATDTVGFANANQALASMMPMYRVGISHQGEVKIIKVAATMPAGTKLDPKWQGSIWQENAVGYDGFWNNLALSAQGVALTPAQDFVTPQMMTNMQWWLDP